jgi:hypothetical protein
LRVTTNTLGSWSLSSGRTGGATSLLAARFSCGASFLAVTVPVSAPGSSGEEENSPSSARSAAITRASVTEM